MSHRNLQYTTTTTKCENCNLKKESKFGGKVFLFPEMTSLDNITPKNTIYSPLKQMTLAHHENVNPNIIVHTPS